MVSYPNYGILLLPTTWAILNMDSVVLSYLTVTHLSVNVYVLSISVAIVVWVAHPLKLWPSILKQLRALWKD